MRCASYASYASYFSRRALTAAVVLVVLFGGLAAAARAQVPPPAVKARSWVLVDATSNQWLASENANMRVEPASLTKLMAAYLVFEALQAHRISMNQTVMPSEAVRRVAPDESRTFIEAHKPVKVHDLVYGMIVQSGNDAAIALAELIGGSEANFVAMMNEKARKMGMTNTHYHDVNGLPHPDHYTTAADLATLSAHLIRDFPDYYSIFAVRYFTYNKIRQSNRNRLLWIDPTVDGLKTGHTQSAGYCLIATAKRAVPNMPKVKRRLVAVMMGERKEHDRVQDSLKILNYGYSAYRMARLLKAGEAIATPRLYKGVQTQVKVGVNTDHYVAVPRDRDNPVKITPAVTSPLLAPLKTGQPVGTVKVMTADGKQLVSVPLVALEDIPQAGILGRLWDAMLLLFKRHG